MRWPVVVVLALVLVVVALASLAPTIERQRDYAALRRSGIVATASIRYCATASDSRPAVVTVTCPGTFLVGGRPVTEDILGLPRPLAEGSTVVVSADPTDTRVVYPVADVRSGYQSGWWTGRTALAGACLVLVLLLVWRQVIVARRRRVGSGSVDRAV
jgi:hypothetical protein